MFWKQLIRTLLPQPCSGCGEQLEGAVGLCSSCRQQLQVRVEQYSPLRATATPHLVTLGPYKGMSRRAIRQLKFAGTRDLAAIFGETLAAGVPKEWGIQAVVPVPLHSSRLRERGFNQAGLISQVIAEQLGISYLEALIRTRPTRQQSKQRASQRDDLSDAFALNPKAPYVEQVLLVDDVLTTGHTLSACHNVLLKNNYLPAYAAVIAH